MKNSNLARHLAWQALMEANVCELPVDIHKIAAKYNIDVIKLSNIGQDMVSEYTQSCYGFYRNINGIFSTLYQNRKVIFINDLNHDKQSRRFALSHLIGYILLGEVEEMILLPNYNMDSNSTSTEQLANIFAKELLMPTCVLSSIGVEKDVDISNFCEVPANIAKYYIKNIQADRARLNSNALHPFEQHVLNQFYEYISKNI